jgi:hypothetical protein
MHLLVAKSTFEYLGDLYEPGDFLRSKEEGQTGPKERPTRHWLSTRLCERPDPEQHDKVEDVEEVPGAILAGHGGGWHTVIDLDGDIREDKIQGRDNALAAAEDHFTSDSTDS